MHDTQQLTLRHRTPGRSRRRWRPASGLSALCLASVTTALLPASPASASVSDSASASASGSVSDSASAAAGRGGETVAGPGFTARIRRTEYGIPHILAHDYSGLGYGYGYAFAQDNLCALADRVVTLRGERSRYFGPDGTPAADAPGTSNLLSDTYYRGLRQAGTVQRLLDRPAPLGPTPDLRRLVDGYAAGYNRYLRDTGAAKLPDPTCEGKPWVGPITALDIWNVVYDVNGANGAASLADTIAAATPPTAGSTPAATTSKARAALTALTSPAANDTADASGSGSDAGSGNLGSNGWALGRDATRDGDGMLLANPHLSWVGGFRFYQVQLTIPGKLDVAGAALYGTPVIEIGHTRGLAWTHTTTHADHASLYRLDLVPGDPTSYTVDGRTEHMKRRTVHVTVRGTDGGLSSVKRTLYTSRYGPVLSFGWTDTTALSLRDANADNLRSMNEWLAMGTSQSVTQLRAAQRTYQGNPWTHTIATDTSGTTWFTDSSVVPHLTDDQLTHCTLPGGDDLPDALDGSNSACAWGSDPDAVVPGIYGPANQPTLTRTDYVANSNNGPYLANPDAPITGLPGVYNTGTRLGLRAQLGLRMIVQRRDGTDGLGAPGFTLDTLRATMLGDRVHSAELGLADVVAMCRANPGSPRATERRSTYGRPATPSGSGTPAPIPTAVAPRSGGLLRAPGRQRSRHLVARAVRPGRSAQHAARHRRRRRERAARPRRRRRVVRVRRPRGRHPLGAVQRWAGIPLPGCDGGAGCFNVVEATADSGSSGAVYPASPDDYAFGAGFVMAVELTPHGPRARTILTYGESADPTSPHFADQTTLFSRKQWVTERFTDAEIKADPSLRVTTLRR